jgi:hypothetical protein
MVFSVTPHQDNSVEMKLPELIAAPLVMAETMHVINGRIRVSVLHSKADPRTQDADEMTCPALSIWRPINARN